MDNIKAGSTSKQLIKKSPIILCLFSLFLFALYIRLQPLAIALENNEIIFWGSDSYDHLRRIVWITNHFPNTFEMNYYQGFPVGTPNLWPPLMHLFIAGCSLIIGLGAPSLSLIEWIAAVFPAVVGALCIFPVYSIGRQLAGRLAGLMAALVLAILPAHVMLTLFSMTDNNSVEPLLAALFLAAAIPNTNSINSNDPNRNQSKHDLHVVKKGIFLGIAGWAFLFTWRGAIMFLLVMIAFGALNAIACRKKDIFHKNYSQILAIACIFWAISTLPFVLMETWGAQNVFKIGTISWFHVIVPLGSALFFHTVSNQRLINLISQKRFAFWGALLGTLVSMLFITIRAFPSFRLDIDLVRLFFDENNLWGVSEFKSLVFINNEFQTKPAFFRFAWGALLAPLAWIVFCARAISSGSYNPKTAYFLFWSLVLISIGVLRIRFIALTAIPVALLIGLFASFIAKYKYISHWKNSGIVVSLAVIIATLYPSFATLSTLPKLNNKLPMTDDLFSSLRWLKSNSPQTSFYNEPWKKPEYGVLAPWDFGSWIEYIGQRPAIATPWGDETYGMKPQAQFYLSEDNSEAYSILKNNQVKYLIISNALGKIKNFARMINIDPKNYYETIINTSGQAVDMLNKKGLNLVFVKLFLNDGLPLSGVTVENKPLENLRMIFESSGTIDLLGTEKKISRIKLFERVDGAILTGTAPAGELVKVELNLISNRKRTFLWESVAKANESGKFSVIVPYSTLSKNGTTRAIGKYRISFADHFYSVDVSEKDIWLSEKVIVN